MDETAEPLNPWQEREELGYPRAFFETVWSALHDRRSLIAGTDATLGVRGPLLFAAIAGALGQIVELIVFTFLSWVLSATLGIALPQVSTGLDSTGLSFLPDWAAAFLGCQLALLAIPLLPLLYVVFLCAVAGAVHLGVLLFRSDAGESAGFSGTLVATCYAMAAFPLQLLPFVGDIVFIIWAIAIQVAGLEKIHAIRRRRALLAALMPFFIALVLGFLALLLALFGSTA